MIAREIDGAIERELRRRPDFSHRVLQEVAANLEPSIRTMDPRRFHAEFVVPAQHRIQESTGRKKKKRARRATVVSPAAEPSTAPDSPAEPPASYVDEPIQPEAPSPPSERPRSSRQAKVRPPAKKPAPVAEAPKPESIAAPPRRYPKIRSPRGSTRAAKLGAGRAVFFDWARALADAESTVEVVAVLTDVDRFVDRLMATTRS